MRGKPGKTANMLYRKYQQKRGQLEWKNTECKNIRRKVTAGNPCSRNENPYNNVDSMTLRGVDDKCFQL